MKKYVYSKGEETVTVETDGLAAINNFMVTGLIGQNYGGLVHAGLAFKMGDTVSIPEMLNAAKRCECKVECYEGGTLIIDESADFTGGDPEPKGIIFGLSLGVAFNEATYNSVVPASYVEQYPYSASKDSLPYSASKDSLPWLVAKFDKQGGDDDEYQVKVWADDAQLSFKNVPESVGTVSADGKVLTSKAKEYIMFDIVRDLTIYNPKAVTWFTIQFIYDNRTYEAKVFVTPNTI
jgi:hypothetical protein